MDFQGLIPLTAIGLHDYCFPAQSTVLPVLSLQDDQASNTKQVSTLETYRSVRKSHAYWTQIIVELWHN
jgi:hypothetical protein